MEKIKMNIIGLSMNKNEHGICALILGEENSVRKMPIVMARTEAMAIAYSLEDKKYFRPFTHDLLKTTIDKMGGEVVEVLISKVEEGIFFAEIIAKQNGEIFSLNARPSDALALAIKSHSPIYSNIDVLKKASFDFEEAFEENTESTYEDSTTTPSEDDILEKYSLQKIQVMLEDAVATENYEKASILKNEIDRRKNE